MEYKLTKQKEERLKEVARKVLEEVRPSPQESVELTSKINQVMGRLKRIVPRELEIMVAGSSARGTNLRGNSDIDIFLLFGKPVSKERMEATVIEVAKRMVKGNKKESYIVKYAEHPYARLFLEGMALKVDLVPAYKITSASERITSVDRTQLHNEFIKSTLSQRQRDDVRTLKAFLKFHGIYGAEAKVEGFSGYLCELLIFSYGSFIRVVTAIANVKPPVVINLSSGQKDPAKLFKVFGKKLIVIDPTDENRNVAANVSDESFARLALSCRALVSDPSQKTFNGIGYSDLSFGAKLAAVARKLGAGVYAVSFETDDISDEIVWQQLRRIMVGTGVELSKLGFAPLLSLQEVDGTTAVMGFVIGNTKREYRVVSGPSALMRDAADAFIAAHKSVIFRYLESDKLYFVEEAECKTPEEAMKRVISKMEVPSHFKKKMRIYANKMPGNQAKLLYRAYMRKTML